MDRRLFASALVVLLSGMLVMPSLADEQDPPPTSSPLWDSEDVIDQDSITVTIEFPDPATMDDCKDGGWEDFGFDNQGRCMQFVLTGRDSRQP